MTTPHLFVADLDGTLLRSDAALSDFAVATLSELLGRGLLFTVASARALPSIRALLRGLPLTLPIIELNGALISDFVSGEHIRVHALDRAVAGRVLASVRERGLAPFVTTAVGGQTRFSHGPLNNRGMQWYRDEKREKGEQRLCRVDDLASALEELALGFTLLDRHDVLLEVMRSIERSCGDQVPRNAVPEVLGIATHIVASNDHDGIVQWLREAWAEVPATPSSGQASARGVNEPNRRAK